MVRADKVGGSAAILTVGLHQIQRLTRDRPKAQPVGRRETFSFYYLARRKLGCLIDQLFKKQLSRKLGCFIDQLFKKQLSHAPTK